MAKCGRPRIYHTEAARKDRNKEAQSAYRRRRDDKIRQLEAELEQVKSEREQLLQRLEQFENRTSEWATAPTHIDLCSPGGTSTTSSFLTPDEIDALFAEYPVFVGQPSSGDTQLAAGQSGSMPAL